MLINRIELLDPVNLFLGAGISKQAPAYAPIWREMQIGFCEALFAKMKSEKWDVADTGTEIEELRRFNFRPEMFWERILNHTSLEFISSALQIVNLGQPNLNHKVIAELCRQGIVNNIITTNFDEYLDQCLPAHFRRVLSQGDAVSGEAARIYFKIHGTIRSPESLQFTLQNTKKLPDWKSALIERCLEGHPLVLAGYSGWDDDIMPRLLEIAPRIPKIIIVRYPGARLDEPVNSLGQFTHTEFIDADFSKETQQWYDGHKNVLKKHFEDPLSSSAAKAPDLKKFYGGVAEKLAMPVIPYLVSLLFELAANRDLSKKYAWLADDACGDKRYQDSVPDELKRQVKVNLSQVVAPQDAGMSQFFMEQAHENYPHESAPVANTTQENIDRVFEYFFGGQLTHEQEQEIERYALGALNMLAVGAIDGSWIQFRAAWCMGRLRQRQNKLAESIEFYQRAGLLPETLDDIQKCSFLLDYGLALMLSSATDPREETLKNAIVLFLGAEKIAVNINDHMTAAKAMMNLARCYVSCGNNDLALEKIKKAREVAQLTGDSALQVRAWDLEKDIKEFIAG